MKCVLALCSYIITAEYVEKSIVKCSVCEQCKASL